jgi:hypothetical protein
LADIASGSVGPAAQGGRRSADHVRMGSLDERRGELRRSLGWALVGGLTIAAITASISLVTGSVGRDEWRVIGTSLGFAVFCALGAAGASLRMGGGERAPILGGMTVVLASAAFLTLLLALWLYDDTDGVWRAWGCLSLATLAASHASLVTSARRPTDTDVAGAMVSASIGLAVIDAFAGILPLADLVDVDEGAAKVVGVLVIALLLTTVLPPILRRLARSETSADPAGPPAPAAAPGERGLAVEILAAADRIEGLGNGSADIRRECERLRSLARSAFR